MALTYIDTDGGKLAIDLQGQGQGQGPLVLCSPGMGDTRDAYAPMAAQLLTQGFSVGCIDPRGHGDSSVGFHRYGDEATADDFITVAEKLGNGHKVVLAGASFSAAAAVIAAGRRPDLVAGLILLGPFLRLGSGGAAMFHAMPLLFGKLWGPSVWKSYAASLWPGLGDKAAKDRAAASVASLTRPGRWAAFQATIAGLDHRVVAPWISKVRASVFVVMGDKDPDWSDPIKEAKWVASNFEDVQTLNVPEAGHAPMLESPELVGSNVLTFLEQLRSKDAFGSSSSN